MSHDQSQTDDEQYTSTFFCRALYDYQADDPSYLPFRQGDIIEVLTRLETGWWDGLLNDQRGWFPSNYATVISDEEAEAALNDRDSQASLPDDSMVDMAHTMSQALSQSDTDADWLNGGDADYEGPRVAGSRNGGTADGGGTKHSDFWVPQVSQDGRIFYVNTQTGQQSADLPTEGDADEDAEVAALSPQASSRAGPTTAYGLVGAVARSQEITGFGVPWRTQTPEPWVRRLADDGLSYYYVNRLDGTISWALPEPGAPPSYSQGEYSGPLASKGTTSTSSTTNTSSILPVSRSDSISDISRLRAGASLSRTRKESESSADIQSDDSDVFSAGRYGSRSTTAVVKSAANGTARPSLTATSSASSNPPGTAALDLIEAEKSAKALQNALSPSPPETVVELSDRIRDSVAAVLRYLQGSSIPRRPERYQEIDRLVVEVGTTVRNLLYVTSTPTGHVPSHLYPRDQRDPRSASSAQTLQIHLKAAQRKVAGTLSKLVLSTLALRYDPGFASSSSDRPNRMESDVLELERAVATFVQEVEFLQEQHGLSTSLARVGGGKRLFGIFSTTNIGLGLPGAGLAGDWRGFGYVPLDDGTDVPQRVLDDDVVIAFKAGLKALEARFGSLVISLRYLENYPERVSQEGQSASAYLSWTLRSLCGVNVANHVDVDGINPDSGPQYRQTVAKARQLVRTLEAATQALYDDGAIIFMAVQSLGYAKLSSQHDRAAFVNTIETVAPIVRSNYVLIAQTLDSLLTIGQVQSSISQGVYRQSIQWRASHINLEDSAVATVPQLADNAPVDNGVVGIEATPAPPKTGIAQAVSITSESTLYGNANHQPYKLSLDASELLRTDSTSETDARESTLIGPPSPETVSPLDEGLLAFLDEDDPILMGKSPSRRGANKLVKLLGEAPKHYIDTLNAGKKPWYLRTNYDQSTILIDPDGQVRAGTPAALVERLTHHEMMDTAFTKNFMMTFKSFMTVNDLFELLTQRFWIPPPPNLKPKELEEWTRMKQQIVRTRVLNILKTLVTDDDILEKDDVYILSRIKEFVSGEEVVTLPAAKQLLILIERAQRGGDAPIRTTYTVPLAPPAPIVPRTSKKLKLLDVDPLELARQLTLMEAALYKKIRPVECLQRSRETKPGKTADHITTIIQLSNKIADWVAETILAREDSQRRARIIKHFISVADRCRTLQNFSSMTAIVSGLNRPPIRRLKRTWEQVNAKFLSQLQICESTVDTNKNFNNYRSTLARIAPPCVPFIGVYLTTLTFINDGAGDKLSGDMINFRKRQKAAEVIQDMKRWQAAPYNFQTVASILSYLEESFQTFQDGVDYGDQFWNLSLEREPREREDEKMARLLQESGFL
ncbi:ras GEF [Dichomitus squalens]|uniref:ras GEF n=1 Tax=Dichomitus squalens (strain LYAD-421) TaxID=732165 RepID=UPI00044122BD|nr:ras GEF [Dichomitus squalens LYAD-421 SS1]EJF63378.1 ras GEF [Dichomitus squalens LYAD-421 SS1]TBU47787.1 ras GEF [Dichomitus squalens]